MTLISGDLVFFKTPSLIGSSRIPHQYDDDDEEYGTFMCEMVLFVRSSLPVATAGTAFLPANLDDRPSRNKAKKMPARDIPSRFLGYRSGGEPADLLRS